MNKYSSSKIYKISSPLGNECYIGSTTNSLALRKAQHIYAYREQRRGYEVNASTSCQLYRKYGIENCVLTLLENYPCENRRELLMKENEWQQRHPLRVNKRLALKV